MTSWSRTPPRPASPSTAATQRYVPYVRDTWRVVSSPPGGRVADTSRRRRWGSPSPSRLPAGIVQRRSPQLVFGRVNSVVSRYELFTLGTFLFVSHFAGHLITDSPLLPCPSLNITELRVCPGKVFQLSYCPHCKWVFSGVRLKVLHSTTSQFTYSQPCLYTVVAGSPT